MPGPGAADSGKRPVIAWFPKATDLSGNPYWPVLQGHLEELGLEFSASQDSYWMSRRWLLENRKRVGVLHFHFVQPMYAVGERASFRRLGRFASDLVLARMLGYRIVWTVHDLMPTWPKEPLWVEMLARYVIAHAAYALLVHCHEAGRLVEQKFRRTRRVYVQPHPNYREQYQPPMNSVLARQMLGLPSSGFIFGFVGGIRPSKGIETLIDAFQALHRPESKLLIAGRPYPPKSYVEMLASRAAASPQIIFRPSEIADEHMPAYLAAADVLVFPFKWVLTSGSVILAMSHGRPVIVPRLGCLPELVGDEAGILYEPDDQASLAAALEEALSVRLADLGAAAVRRASNASWHDLALRTMEVYFGRL